MGGGAIHDGGADPGNVDAVQGGWIPGTVQILYVLSGLLHGLADPGHQGGFSRTGTALKYQQIIVPLRIAELGKQALEALAAVGSQEKACGICHGFSSRSYKFSLHNMRQMPPLTKGVQK